MPIIIDINCLSSVFSQSSDDHKDFKPVLEWILFGKGKMVYGGTTYLKELSKAKKYLKIIQLLRDSNRVILGNHENVDKIEKEVIVIEKDDDFDDPHLLAIVVDTKCRLICSKDMRAVKFLKDPKFYPKGVKIPSFYSGKVNESLLSDKYVNEVFKPLGKINKKRSEIILGAIKINK